jgi:negative regulator of replication initiation
MDAQTIVNNLAICWNIKTFIEKNKDFLGTDHYQMIYFEAISRFLTLISFLLSYMDEQRSFMNLPDLKPWRD